MTYRKGYFKALLDVLHLIEWISKAGAMIKPAQRLPIIQGIINDVLMNHKVDYFMATGGEPEFKYKFEKNKLVNIEVGEIKED